MPKNTDLQYYKIRGAIDLAIADIERLCKEEEFRGDECLGVLDRVIKEIAGIGDGEIKAKTRKLKQIRKSLEKRSKL